MNVKAMGTEDGWLMLARSCFQVATDCLRRDEMDLYARFTALGEEALGFAHARRERAKGAAS